MSDAEQTQGSELRIHPNRWVTFVTADGHEVSLRPPRVGEFRQIRAAYKAAETTAAEAAGGLPVSGGTLKVIDLDGVLTGEETSPSAEAFSAMLDIIGSTSIRGDDLPTWAAQNGIYLVLAKVWREVPIQHTGLSDVEKPVEVKPHFDPPEPGAPQGQADGVEEPRWPEVDPTGGMQPGLVRTPQRA